MVTLACPDPVTASPRELVWTLPSFTSIRSLNAVCATFFLFPRIIVLYAPSSVCFGRAGSNLSCTSWS